MIVLFLQSLTVHHFILLLSTLEGPPYNGPYREASPERVTFLRLEECERLGISTFEDFEETKKTLWSCD